MSKGGVAKTTSVLNIGAGFARSGKRVLMIDLDGQANLSGVYKLKDKPENVYNFLMDDIDIPVKKVAKNLSIIPGADAMHSFDAQSTARFGEEAPFLLRDRLNQYDLQESYDIIIIDCPPKIDRNTVNALCFVEWVFLPVTAESFAVEGLARTIDMINRVGKGYNQNLKIGGLFLTQYNNRPKLYQAFRQGLSKHYHALLLEYSTRTNVAVSEAIAEGMDIFSYDEKRSTKSNGAEDYTNIIREILFITGKENEVPNLKI